MQPHTTGTSIKLRAYSCNSVVPTPRFPNSIDRIRQARVLEHSFIMPRPVKRIRAEEQRLQASASVSASSSSAAGFAAAATAAAPGPTAPTAAPTPPGSSRPQSRAGEILHEPQLWADVLMFLSFEDTKQCTAVDHYFLREVSPYISYGKDFVMRIKVTPFLAMLHYSWEPVEDRTPDEIDLPPMNYDAIDQILYDYIKNIKKSECIANYDGKDLKSMVKVAQKTAKELPCRFCQVERVKIDAVMPFPVRPSLVKHILSSHIIVKCLGIFGMDSNKDYSWTDDKEAVLSEFEDAFHLGRSTLLELDIERMKSDLLP